MTEEQARAYALRAWRGLVSEKRRDESATAFLADGLADEITFPCPGDRARILNSWLQAARREEIGSANILR